MFHTSQRVRLPLLQPTQACHLQNVHTVPLTLLLYRCWSSSDPLPRALSSHHSAILAIGGELVTRPAFFFCSHPETSSLVA